MAKTKARRTPVANKRTVAPKAEGLRATWDMTLEALGSAEAALEKQVRGLLKRNRIAVDDASELLKEFQARVVKERKKAVRELESRLKTLQARVKKERRHVGKLANDAVQSALATFNIPSRREVAELTLKVDELSRKIDSLRRK